MGIRIRKSGTSRILAAAALLGACAFFGLLFAQDRNADATGTGTDTAPFDNIIHAHAGDMLERGREIFRYDTFGSQDFGGGTLELHQAIEGSQLGGVGPGVSPKTALAVGLKVDLDALPPQLITALEKGQVYLDDPATTLALLN